MAPLALQAAWEVVAWAVGRWSGPDRRVLIVAIGVAAIGFAAIQVPGPAVEVYRVALGVLQWPFAAAAALLTGEAPQPISPVIATPDVSNLLALPALGVVWWVGSRRSGGPPREVGAVQR